MTRFSTTRTLQQYTEFARPQTHAPRQRRGGARLEGAFESSAVAWCYGVLRHAVANYQPLVIQNKEMFLCQKLAGFSES
jgi:hypothetical protein